MSQLLPRNILEQVRQLFRDMHNSWGHVYPHDGPDASTHGHPGTLIAEEDIVGSAHAIHDNVASEFAGITQKATPVDADLLLIEDSEDSFNKKYVEMGDVSGGGGGHEIRENGSAQTQRAGLNFIDADAGATLVADDAGNDETEVNLGLYVLEAQHSSASYDAGHHARSHAMTGTSDHTAGNWKLIYTNGSGQVVELSLGAAATFLRSAGASSAPTMSALVVGDLPLSTTFVDGLLTWAPDADVDSDILAGDQQGRLFHSGPNGFTALSLIADYEVAGVGAGAGIVITVAYGDTNDLDTVASWTTIATVTNATTENTIIQTSMTNASVPADRLVRMSVTSIAFATSPPQNGSISLTLKRPLRT